MQIELSERTEHLLAAQAAARGRSLGEHVEGVLRRYAEALADPRDLTGKFAIKTHEDALAWILSRNPHIDENRPEDTDWQALKAEGRRY